MVVNIVIKTVAMVIKTSCCHGKFFKTVVIETVIIETVVMVIY